MPDQVIEGFGDCPKLVITHSSAQVPEADRAIPYTKQDESAIVKVEVEYGAGLQPGDPVQIWYRQNPVGWEIVETTDWDTLFALQLQDTYNFTGTPPRIEYQQSQFFSAGNFTYPVDVRAEGGIYAPSGSNIIPPQFFPPASVIHPISFSYLESATRFKDGVASDGWPIYREDMTWEDWMTEVEQIRQWYYGDADGNPLGEANTKIKVFEKPSDDENASWTQTNLITISGDARLVIVECENECQDDCLPLYNSRGAVLCLCNDGEPNETDKIDYASYQHSDYEMNLDDFNP